MKQLVFEYFLKSIYKYQSESNSIGSLKAMKLLFFTCLINSEKGSDPVLLDIFDNFRAMPYGHIEGDIFDMLIKKNPLNYFEVSNKEIKVIGDLNKLEEDIHSYIKYEINKSINLLSEVNPEIFSMSAFELIDLSHLHYSWRKTYVSRKDVDNYSPKIEKDIIIKQDRVYH